MMAILPLGMKVIYGLVDPRDGVVRYIGVTDSPQRRFKEHLREKSKSEKTAWIKELLLSEREPIFVFLDTVPAFNSDTMEREWIAHFQSIGALTNFKTKK